MGESSVREQIVRCGKLIFECFARTFESRFDFAPDADDALLSGEKPAKKVSLHAALYVTTGKA